jgi:chromosome segregation ATPase
MCKKLCLAVGAAIVGLVVIGVSPRLSALMSDKYHSVKTWMDAVPPETQLQQLRAETEKIDQDIKKNLGKLAAQEVEAERLEASLDKMKTNQTALREEITAMNKALDSKETKVSYNGRTFRQSELASRLESKTSEYERIKAEVKSRELALNSKHQMLELAHQRIGEMRKQKDALRVDIAKLEARIENIKLKQVDCPVSIDESQVSKCRALADKLDRQLAEEEKKTELLQKYGYEQQSNSPSVREEKTIEEIKQAAKKALQDDDSEKVVDNKN